MDEDVADVVASGSDAPSAPSAPTAVDTGYGTTSGSDDLRLAFTAQDEGENTDSTPEGKDAAPAGAVQAQAAGAAPPTEASPTTRTSPLSPEALQAEVQRRVQEEIDTRSRLAQEQQYQQYLAQMPDHEYGRVMRQYAADLARYGSLQAQMAEQFYVEATTQLRTHIPELQKVTPEVAQKLDPHKYNSFGEFIAAVGEVVAESRSSKAAEKAAKAQFEAWKTEELQKLHADLPGTPNLPPGSAADPGVNLDKLSGREVLQHAFSR